MVNIKAGLGCIPGVRIDVPKRESSLLTLPQINETIAPKIMEATSY